MATKRIVLTMNSYVNGVNKSILPQNRKKLAEVFFNKQSDRAKSMMTADYIMKMPVPKRLRFLKSLWPKRIRKKKA